MVEDRKEREVLKLLQYLLADLGFLVQSQTKSEHGVVVAIKVDVVDGIQIKCDHLVHEGEDQQEAANPAGDP